MKKKMLSLLKFGYFFSCCFVLYSNTAHAYIDPSTTTYIIQGIAGILVAVGAMFTVFRHKIKAAWRKWYYGRVARKYRDQAAAGGKDHQNSAGDRQQDPGTGREGMAAAGQTETPAGQASDSADGQQEQGGQ